MVSRAGLRRHLTIAAAVCAAVLVVAAIAHKEPTDGAFAVVVALVLAPVAVILSALAARRLAGARAAAAAAVVYVLLPLLGNRLMLGTYRSTFDRHAIPALVGLHAPGTFAVGIALVAIAALAPARVAAAGGVLLAVVALVLFGGSLGTLPPNFHETVWSVTFTEWLVVATILGALLRSIERGLALGGIAIAVVALGAHRGYDDGVFWATLAAAAPAAAVLLTSLAFLVPRRRPARAAAQASARPER
ncbi:MAG TPA: hypothetical protein VFA97_02545 [Gaiellaceae bacterium]|nr:hypothetical protein [Gaiellaceae bacterium]